jgi:hypothetical protein
MLLPDKGDIHVMIEMDEIINIIGYFIGKAISYDLAPGFFRVSVKGILYVLPGD